MAPYTIYPGQVLVIHFNTQRGVVYPIYGAGTALGTQTNGGLIFFTASNGFNFTSDTTATQFSLTGSFQSPQNFTFYSSYGNTTDGSIEGGFLLPTLEANGSYVLDVNVTYPKDDEAVKNIGGGQYQGSCDENLHILPSFSILH